MYMCMLRVLRQHIGGGRDPCASGIGEVWLCIAKKEVDINASNLKINPCYAGVSPYPFVQIGCVRLLL